MEISDFKKYKRDMELELRSHIADAILKFTNETGYYVNSVDVRFVQNELMGSTQVQYLLSDVTTDVDI